MSFMTVLEKIGHDVAVGFEDAIKVFKEAQPVLAPFEALINPALPNLLTAGANAIANIEGLAAAAGQQNGSGAVKLASVTATLANNLGPTLTALGVNPTTVTSTQYTNFINAIVAASNAFVTTQEVATATPVVISVPAAIPGTAANPMVK